MPQLQTLIVLYFNTIQVMKSWKLTFNVMPTKSDSDVILCLQLLSKTITCTLHLS